MSLFGLQCSFTLLSCYKCTAVHPAGRDDKMCLFLHRTQAVTSLVMVAELHEETEGRAGCGISGVSQGGPGARAPAQRAACAAGSSRAGCCGGSCPSQVRTPAGSQPHMSVPLDIADFAGLVTPLP